MMHNALIDFLRESHHIPEDFEQFLDQIVEVKTFQKGEYIYEPGAYLKHIYFIEAGFTRQYYFKAGKDITHLFFGVKTFNTSMESVYYQKPSVFGFQALVQTRVWLIPFSSVNELSKTNLTVSQFIQKLLLDTIIGFSNRFYNSQFETAQERYQFLITENPTLFQYASLGHIASYLGVSQQTLSVIRGKI